MMKSCKYAYHIQSFKQLVGDESLQKHRGNYEDLNNYSEALMNNLQIMKDLSCQ